MYPRPTQLINSNPCPTAPILYTPTSLFMTEIQHPAHSTHTLPCTHWPAPAHREPATLPPEYSLPRRVVWRFYAAILCAQKPRLYWGGCGGSKHEEPASIACLKALLTTQIESLKRPVQRGTWKLRSQPAWLTCKLRNHKAAAAPPPQQSQPHKWRAVTLQARSPA